jgi:hypothetical protein
MVVVLRSLVVSHYDFFVRKVATVRLCVHREVRRSIWFHEDRCLDTPFAGDLYSGSM